VCEIYFVSARGSADETPNDVQMNSMRLLSIAQFLLVLFLLCMKNERGEFELCI